MEVSGAKNSMKTPDYYYDGPNLPFDTGSVDGVISTQVLKHIPDARLLIKEMSRIVKPNGSMILSILILLNVYILNNLTPKIPGIGFLFNLIFCFLIQLIAITLQSVLPDKGSLHIYLIVKAKKLY